LYRGSKNVCGDEEVDCYLNSKKWRARSKRSVKKKYLSCVDKRFRRSVSAGTIIHKITQNFKQQFIRIAYIAEL